MPDFERILETIERAVACATADSSMVAVAYSGGLDSTIVASLARKSVEIRCYTACIRGSYDCSNVSVMAAEEEFEVEVIELKEEDITNLVIRAGQVLETHDPIRIGYTIPLLAVIEAAEEETILAGNGADELFAGYAKYESARDVVELMKRDLKKALYELSKLCVYANYAHKRLIAPFATAEVIKAASAISMHDKLQSGVRKPVLRKVALEIGVHGFERPKKAAQYSSGVMKAMVRIAKDQGLSVGAWTEAQITGRPHATI